MDRVQILTVRKTLLICLDGDVDDSALDQLTEDLATVLSKQKTHGGVVMNISGVPVVDSFVAAKFIELSRVTKSLGSAMVVVGMRPAVALSLVEMGISLEQVATARDFDRGLKLLKRLRS